MKVKVLQENVLQAIQHVIKTVPSRPQLSILSSILVTTSPSGLVLSATDLYMGIRVEVMGQTLEEGSIALPAKTFLDSIQSLSAGQLELELIDQVLQIKTRNEVIKVQGQASDDYPEFPTPSGHQITLPVEKLETIDTYVRFAVGQDPTRVVLTTVLLLFSGKELQVVGTDGFRLAIIKTPLEVASEFDSLLLPVRALSEACRIARHEKVTDITFFVSQELKQVSFNINTTEMFVRLVEGEYPPYEKIVPHDFSLIATWDGEEFASQIKRALIFARESSNIVRLTIGEEKLHISAKSAAHGEYQGEMNLNNQSGVSDQIAFNGRYVLEFIANTKPETIWFGMNESLKPAMFKVAGRDEYSYIVMPFRVTE